MKKFIFVLALFSFALAREPLSFAPQHPARLAYYSLYAQSPDIHQGGSAYITLMQTNEYEEERIFFLDYGLATLQFDLRYGLDEYSQLRLIAPFHYVYGGFLDGVLDWFHSVTGTLNGNSHNRYGKYKVHVHFGDVSKDSPFFSTGNIQIQYKQQLPFPIPSAIVIGIKIPSAQKSRHLGSGHLDVAAEVTAKKRVYDSTLLFQASVARIGEFRLGDFAKSRRWIYEAIIEWQYEKWQLQYRFSSSPYRSDYKEVDSISNVINIGYALTKNLTIFASENLSPFYNSPDITFGLTYSY